MTLLTRWLAIGSGVTVLAGSVAIGAQQAAPAPASAAAPIDFARDIQPVLEQYCYECHGRTKARARLRLHSPDFIRRGGNSGPAILPGRSSQSELIRRLVDPSDDDRMPLDSDPLPDDIIARFKAWIDQGAPMPGAALAEANGAGAAATDDLEEHWAYVKPARPEPPAVANASWVRNPIDRFVLARLEKEKLAPAPEAARTTLLRRVTLDLTGLPPTLDEVDAFLADTSANAYEKAVDRLLASPHYGERWARPWLDLARYADTNGYEKDNRRSIWKYRDWVIETLNKDLPFDQFTIEQIAGDMLPNATIEQQIASGFHRNAMTNEEGGVDPEESRYEVLVDRVNTTATVWLGTTLACAQCHNHKYDPFSQKDYFRMLAFFASSDYDSRSFGDGTRYFEPTLDLATPEQEAARKKLQADIDRLDQELKTVTPAVREAQEGWEQAMRAAQDSWTPLAPKQVSATNGVILKVQPDGSVLASGPNPPLTSYTVVADTAVQGITGVQLEALPDPALPRGGPGRDGYGHFRITGMHVSIAAANGGGQAPQPVEMATIKVDDSAAPFEPAHLLSSKPRTYSRKGGSWAINAMRDTIRVPRHAVLASGEPFGFPQGTRITVRIDHLDGTIGQGIGRFRLLLTTSDEPLEGADLAARRRPILRVPAAERTTAQADELGAAFRAFSPLLKPVREAIAEARKALTDLQIPSTLVMKERPSFERPSYELRERGSFAAKGERVYAATPGALHPMRSDLPINRLGLARWLVDSDNPLVARVAVNRFWEQIFGRGLVETSEDFGSQSSPPTHRELLDWLATEFMAQGWSRKAMLRTIVLSSTYRQSSAMNAELADKDPYNRLFARGPRVRMEAEMVRDAALAATGLLDLAMFGPSVFPLQPEGVWNMPFNSDRWVTSRGADRHRRSLYTFWRRTSPYPAFMTFDATSREYCTVRRVRTNTPLQALTLLNDPASFEAARALALLMITAGDTPAARARTGMKRVLSREPAPAELDRLVATFDKELVHYRDQPEAAAQVAGDVADTREASIELA
ncbi:MAG: PSD1 and planctomycete cytochrome C domain-containing protein, partial [Vicinamibacterales bacterium]